MPKITVIMNCFNGAEYLKEAIDSIYAQTFNDWEIVFWDNASTDKSADIVRNYDERIRYFCSKKTVVLGAARKLALSKAKGEWVGFLDADDLWHPEKLEKQINAVDGTDYVLCYTGVRDITSEGKIIREIIPKYSSGWQLESQLRQFDINMVTPLINRRTLDVFNLSFDKNIVASEEYNLFIRLAAKGKFCTIPEVLGSWRIAEDTLTNQSAEFWSKDRIYTLNQLKKENPGIANLYGDAIQEAHSRAIYYKARWLMVNKRYSEARYALKTIAKDSIVYLILYFISFSKRFWFVVHSDKVKRKMASKVFTYSKKA